MTTEPDTAPKSLGTTGGVPEHTVVEDEDSVDKADQIIELLQQLLAQKGADEELPLPGEEETIDEDVAGMEPLDKLAKDLEQPKGPAEVESNFVDPEEINEQDEDVDFPDPAEMEDEDPEMENVPNKETYPTEDEDIEEEEKVQPATDRAIRMAIDAIKPYIASLPRNQRRAAADAAVRQLRTRMGKDAKPRVNGYAKIAKAKRRAADSSNKLAGRALGKKITAERNCNYKK